MNLVRAFTFYWKTIKNRIPFVANVVVDFLMTLRDKNYINSYDQVKITGFSLGSHFAGHIGRILYERTDEKVAMILGNSN